MFSIPKHSFCSFSSIAVLWLSMPLPSLQSNATTYPVSLQFNLWHVRCKKFPKHSTKISQFKKIPQKVKPVNIITLLRVIPTLAFQDIYFDIYFDNLPNILSDIYSDILSGILHFIWYMFWQSFWHILTFHLAAEVQRCPLSSEGPRLRSSGAHWARKIPGWGPAVPTARGSWRRAKSWQCGSGRGSGGRGGGGEGGGRGGGGQGGAGTAVIKSNNPHLAGGELIQKTFKKIHSNRLKKRNAIGKNNLGKPTNFYFKFLSCKHHSKPFFQFFQSCLDNIYKDAWLDDFECQGSWAPLPTGSPFPLQWKHIWALGLPCPLCWIHVRMEPKLARTCSQTGPTWHCLDGPKCWAQVGAKLAQVDPRLGQWPSVRADSDLHQGYQRLDS